MDGLQAAREIHQHLPELPIVMYTMHWSSQLQVEAMKSGISRVVAKADSASLVAAVQELVKAVPAEASIQPLDPIAIPPQTPLALPAIEAAPADASETTGAPADDPAEPDEPIPPAS
jgi:DNA-binding NarL/FixJ family response regulator